MHWNIDQSTTESSLAHWKFPRTSGYINLLSVMTLNDTTVWPADHAPESLSRWLAQSQSHRTHFWGAQPAGQQICSTLWNPQFSSLWSLFRVLFLKILHVFASARCNIAELLLTWHFQSFNSPCLIFFLGNLQVKSPVKFRETSLAPDLVTKLPTSVKPPVWPMSGAKTLVDKQVKLGKLRQCQTWCKRAISHHRYLCSLTSRWIDDKAYACWPSQS